VKGGSDLEAVMVFFLVFILFFYLIGGLMLLLPYIFRAVGLNGIMKGRGLPAGWRAWVPVVQMWSLGKLADDVGREKGARIWCATTLLWLSIAKAVLYVAGIAGLAIYAILQAQYYYFYSSETVFTVVYTIVFLLLVVVHIGHVVICFMAYYRIVAEYAPNAAIGVLVGGVLAGTFGFSATLPYDICLFVIRKRRPLSRILVHQPWNGGYETAWGGWYPPQGPPPAQPWNPARPYSAPPVEQGSVQPWNTQQGYTQPWDAQRGYAQPWSAQQGYTQPWSAQYAQQPTAPNANSWNAPMPYSFSVYSGVPVPQAPSRYFPVDGTAGQPPSGMG